MRACIIGCGLEGLATGVTLAHLGHRVRLVEGDEILLKSVTRGTAFVHEPRLASLLSGDIRRRSISVTSDIGEAVRPSEIVFLTADIPIMRSGAPQLKHLRAVAQEFSEHLTEDKTVVLKSAVPPGTTQKFVVPLLEEGSGLAAGRDFGVAVNPGFLRPGSAVQDSLEPPMIVVGSTPRKTGERVMSLFEKIDASKIVTDIDTAELIRLAFSCRSALELSYAAELANICERLGTDARQVIEGALKGRVSAERALAAGLGFGGGVLPRDLSMLTHAAESSEYRPELLRAVSKLNDVQPLRAIELLEEELGPLEGKRIALLGLASDAGVDDTVETRAFRIAIELLARGARVVGYDSRATAAFMGLLPEISYASSTREALLDADGCVVQTGEREFSRLGKDDFALMRERVVVDGRRALSPTKMSRYGVRIRVVGLGRRR